MAKCLLSYSSAYGHLKEPFMRLLNILGFEVDVFDEPNIERPPKSIVEERISAVDAVVVLYGPSLKPDATHMTIEGALWPHFEADYAIRQNKPLALIVHPKTQLPVLLEDYQTYPQFDFWKSEAFLENVHHIVKHLLDLKRRIDMPEGSQPYYFKNVVCRNKINFKGDQTRISVYHEVVARQVCSRFLHTIDTGADETSDAKLGKATFKQDEVATYPPNEYHRVTLTPLNCTDYKFDYYIDIEPPLGPGERLGYRRIFVAPNRFPLSYDALLIRSKEAGFPLAFPSGFYGDYFEVPYEIEKITLAIHFPMRVKIEEKNVLVLHSLTFEENRAESEKSKRLLRLEENPGLSEHVLELTVWHPVINHNYYLLYRPGK